MRRIGNTSKKGQRDGFSAFAEPLLSSGESGRVVIMVVVMIVVIIIMALITTIIVLMMIIPIAL